MLACNYFGSIEYAASALEPNAADECSEDEQDSQEMLDDNILRAREVLKTDGWVLVTKKNGEKSILRVEKRELGRTKRG